MSGEARRGFAPLGEIHDTSMPGGSAALSGFFGEPAHVRKSVPEDDLRAYWLCDTANLRRISHRVMQELDGTRDWVARSSSDEFFVLLAGVWPRADR